MALSPWTRVIALLSILLVMVAACAPEQDVAATEDTPARSSQVQERITSSGYAPRPVAGGFQVHNRAQGFDATFTGKGVKVGAMEMSLRSWGREGAERQVERVPVGEGECGSPVDADGACIHRLAYTRPGITEWWENRPDGLEQGFTLDAPDGDGALVIDIAVDGAVLEGDGTSARIGDLRYSGLVANDETGRNLPAWMEETEDGLRLVVDDADAGGRITVDPLLTSAAWMAESDQDFAFFGDSVSSAGDVNGDGYGDVVVGAKYYDNGQGEVGRAFLYLGSASGLAGTASWTAESDQSGVEFGGSVSTAGDVNGDGYGDVIIGAMFYENGEWEEGRAWLYLGSASGLAGTASWTAESDQASAYFGQSVSTAGDVNGDGYGDVAVGAGSYENGPTSMGRVFLYLGSASGLSTAPAWTAESDENGGWFGSALSSAGDVNGDGYGDLVVGAYMATHGQTAEGRAFLYLGSASGLSTTASWTAESDKASADFGKSVSTAGDINGDGYSDVVVGAPNYNNGQSDRGRAYLYLGSASGLSATDSWAVGADQDANFGSVSSAGDVNGDGYADVVVGAGSYENGQTAEGRTFLYLGSASGLATTASWTVESDQDFAELGSSVSSAGDVNGDGLGDVIVGAPHPMGWPPAGRVYLYLGSASVLAATAEWTGDGWTVCAMGRFGESVSSAGDVNGDGFGDVIVGDPYCTSDIDEEGRVSLYQGSASGLSTTVGWSAAPETEPGSRFGSSVSSAGDVNADGYGDVIVGSRYGTFLYHGSVSGLSTSVSWTDPAQVEHGVPSSAGDVNNDGFSDVVIGDPNYGNGQTAEGRAWLYLGSVSGLSASASWTAESDQASDYFGSSVSSAGDVNGDGYGDVFIDANVYLGSASGMTTSTPWTLDPGSRSVRSAGDVNGDGFGDFLAQVGSQIHAFFGSASGPSPVTSWTVEDGSGFSAGDVNGDGFGDIVITYSYPYEYEAGRAYVYFGSASGPSATATWMAEGSENSFGASAASAGDVNGDGYGDMVIGMPTPAYAFLYLGNGADGTGPGLSLSPQARQSGTSTPISPGLVSSSESSFDVAMASARGPWGRSRVKMQVEAKPLGTAFDGTGLVSQSSYTSTGLTGTSITQPLTGLSPDTGYHWRARVLVSPAEGQKQGWGPWKYGGLSGDAHGGHVFTAGSAPLWYADADGDGFGDLAVQRSSPTQPTGYVADATDCDDTSAGTNPAVDELCGTSWDDNCNGDLHDAPDAPTFWPDSDNDNYGGAGVGVQYCFPPPGLAENSWDCDDANASIHPGQAERCSTAEDDDCDGQINEGTATDAQTWYRDADNDTYGTASATTLACVPPSGHSANSGDCDDANASINPAATEIVGDEVDQDCDGQEICYVDADNDNFRLTTTSASPDSYCTDSGEALSTDPAGDCDDANAAIHPGITEICDAANTDEDCDGLADDASAAGQPTWYRDSDEDGFGSPTSSTTACDLPAGYLADATDCDDVRPAVNPDATEVCNTLDDDCDGFTDEPDSADAPFWYLDEDADGYGVDTDAQASCTQPPGYALLEGDCDDSDPLFNPGATETDCADPSDYNCDGSISYVDADADGFAACEDCDDREAATNPDATETCDGFDDDCDGSVDEDATDASAWFPDTDRDGYGSPDEATVACTAPVGAILASESLGDDCDDTNPAVNPGAAEVCGKLDDDCDGAVDEAGATGEATWYADLDQDGFVDPKDTVMACDPPENYIPASKLWDCDDANAEVNPDAAEICNTIDDDCDGNIDENLATRWYADFDGDGYGDPANTLDDCAQPDDYVADATDCDVANPEIHPGADEIPGDTIDQDCDGVDLVLDSGDSGHGPDSGPVATDTGETKTGGCGGCASTQGSRQGWLLVAMGLLGMGWSIRGQRRKRS